MADISTEKTLLSIASMGLDIRNRIVNLLAAVNNGKYNISVSAQGQMDRLANNEKLIAAGILNQMRTIGSNAFQSCSWITEVEFANVLTVYDLAFDGCTNLASVTLPACTTIGSNAFAGCDNLSLYLTGSVVPELVAPSSTFTGSAKIYVMESLYSAYLANASWYLVSSRIVSMAYAPTFSDPANDGNIVVTNFDGGAINPYIFTDPNNDGNIVVARKSGDMANPYTFTDPNNDGNITETKSS